MICSWLDVRAPRANPGACRVAGINRYYAAEDHAALHLLPYRSGICTENWLWARHLYTLSPPVEHCTTVASYLNCARLGGLARGAAASGCCCEFGNIPLMSRFACPMFEHCTIRTLMLAP